MRARILLRFRGFWNPNVHSSDWTCLKCVMKCKTDDAWVSYYAVRRREMSTLRGCFFSFRKKGSKILFRHVLIKASESKNVITRAFTALGLLCGIFETLWEKHRDEVTSNPTGSVRLDYLIVGLCWDWCLLLASTSGRKTTSYDENDRKKVQEGKAAKSSHC